MASILAGTIHNIHRPRSLVVRVLGITVDSFFTLPGGYGIDEIFYWETAGNAVTGGIDIGTTDGGAQVVAAQAVAGNSMNLMPAAALLLSVFSISPPVPQLLYIHAHTAWNNAVLNLQFGCAKLNP